MICSQIRFVLKHKYCAYKYDAVNLWIELEDEMIL
jgi:hypothetical protein